MHIVGMAAPVTVAGFHVGQQTDPIGGAVVDKVAGQIGRYLLGEPAQAVIGERGGLA